MQDNSIPLRRRRGEFFDQKLSLELGPVSGSVPSFYKSSIAPQNTQPWRATEANTPSVAQQPWSSNIAFSAVPQTTAAPGHTPLPMRSIPQLSPLPIHPHRYQSYQPSPPPHCSVPGHRRSATFSGSDPPHTASRVSQRPPFPPHNSISGPSSFQYSAAQPYPSSPASPYNSSHYALQTLTGPTAPQSTVAAQRQKKSIKNVGKHIAAGLAGGAVGLIGAAALNSVANGSGDAMINLIRAVAKLIKLCRNIKRSGMVNQPTSTAANSGLNTVAQAVCGESDSGNPAQPPSQPDILSQYQNIIGQADLLDTVDQDMQNQQESYQDILDQIQQSQAQQGSYQDILDQMQQNQAQQDSYQGFSQQNQQSQDNGPDYSYIIQEILDAVKQQQQELAAQQNQETQQHLQHALAQLQQLLQSQSQPASAQQNTQQEVQEHLQQTQSPPAAQVPAATPFSPQPNDHGAVGLPTDILAHQPGKPQSSNHGTGRPPGVQAHKPRNLHPQQGGLVSIIGAGWITNGGSSIQMHHVGLHKDAHVSSRGTHVQTPSFQAPAPTSLHARAPVQNSNPPSSLPIRYHQPPPLTLAYNGTLS